MERFLCQMKADKENASKKGWTYDKQRLRDGVERRRISGASE